MKKYNNWFYEIIEIDVPSFKGEGSDYFKGVEILGYDFGEKANLSDFQIKKLKIPEFIKKIPVISIGRNAFEWKNTKETRASIKVLYLPNNLLCVKERAFKFRGIEEIKFGFSLRVIKECSFLGNEIEYLKFPESLLEIKYGAFDGNPIESINFGKFSKIRKIGEFAFDLTGGKYKGTKSKLKEVSFDKKVDIDKGAFPKETKIKRT